MRLMFGKNISWRALLSHITLFIAVEIIFVLIVFREFPETNLYSTIGIAHISYWIVVLLCSLRREQAKKLLTRSTALWTPMLYHLFIHIWIGLETVEEHTGGHEHHETELFWLIIGTLVAGVIIYGGEKLIHQHNHCATHHHHVHKDCLEHGHHDCEKDHT